MFDLEQAEEGFLVAVRRKAQTQTEAYWRRDFKIRPEDLEAVYDTLLEEGRPKSLDELAREVIARHCRREALALEPEEVVAYKPKEHYSVGQRLYFPSLAYATGRVVGMRPGQNPRYGPFTVVEVQLEGEEKTREFATDLAIPHRLNDLAEEAAASEDLLTPEQLCERYGEPVRRALAEALAGNTEFVLHGGLWFLRGLLPEVHVGHLNLAEAVVDVAGRPLMAQEILQQVELGGESKPEARVFALTLALEGDGRFDNVGTAENPRWFLYNLEPPAVAAKPERLQANSLTTGDELLHRESLEIVRELQDELDELPDRQTAHALPESGRASFVLNYPHRQEGTFPLTREVLALFPSEEYTRIPIRIVDGRTNSPWPGWVLPAERYGWGLAEWYRREEIPAGATVDFLLTRDPYTVVVQCDQRSRRSEWVRAPKAENQRLTFEIRKRAYTCRFDRNLLLGDPTDAGRVDQLRRQYQSAGRSLLEVILAVFPELAKLGSQGTVSVKALYAAVNVLWRTGAVPICAELARQACFDPVGGGNWVFEEELLGQVYKTAEEMETRPLSRRVDLIRDRVLRYSSPA